MTNFEQKEFENALLENLSATEDTLKEWENNNYYIDSDIVRQFWDRIRKAPGVAIVGDYDCDGICATKIMVDGVHEICPNVKIFAREPRRFTEGYGINAQIATEIKEKLPKGSVVVTVDNGIAAADILEGLEKDGYPVLMTDHHELRKGCKIPNVTMTLDPSVSEISEGFSFKDWCGAAVAFKLCEQVVSQETAKKMEVYAGIATVADCMNLRGGNWGLVRKTISAFRNGKAPEELVNMLVSLKQDPRFASEDTFGFYLGPCFNAAGRLEDEGAKKVLGYLVKPTDAKLAELVNFNNERKRIRDEEFELIKNYIHETGQEDKCPVYVNVPGLHEGMLGIHAGKITEKYGVPSIVVTSDNAGNLKGSARSTEGFDIFHFLEDCKGKFREEQGLSYEDKDGDGIDLFIRMGGHPGAAGLSITASNFEKLSANLLDKASVQTATSKASEIHIEPYDIPELYKILCKVRPFGEGNPAPIFEMDINVSKEGGRMMGSEKNHLCIDAEDKTYKITHFYHTPNELSNQNCFNMVGRISGSAFLGRETPTFNADEVRDIEVIKEQSIEK